MADEWLLKQYYLGRAREERLAGYYHSHPDSAPDPSPADLRGHPPGATFLILGAGGTYKIVRLLEIPPEDRTDGGQVLVDHSRLDELLEVASVVDVEQESDLPT